MVYVSFWGVLNYDELKLINTRGTWGCCNAAEMLHRYVAMNQNSVINKRSNVKDVFFTLIVTPVVSAYFVARMGVWGGGKGNNTAKSSESNKQTPQ